MPIVIQFDSEWYAKDYVKDISKKLNRALEISPTGESFSIGIGDMRFAYNAIVAYKIVIEKYTPPSVSSPAKPKKNLKNNKIEDFLM